MAISCILGLMYRYFLIFLLFFIPYEIYGMDDNRSQSKADNDTEIYMQLEDIEDPDEAGTPMPNVGISEEKAIVEVVEGVGNVPYMRVAFREKPSLKSKVIRYSSGAEKVILAGESGDWYKVVMYNNKEAYIQKRYVRTAKIFLDETTTKNYMNKTVSIELNDLLNRFDDTVKNSSYVEKYQTRPIFTLKDARKVRGKVTLTFYYSCADAAGNPIPSYSENKLYTYQQKLLELILGRLILSNVDNYEIIIKTPVFNETGGVVNYNNVYASMTLDGKLVKKENIRDSNFSLLKLVSSTVPVGDLFKTYPK